MDSPYCLHCDKPLQQSDLALVHQSGYYACTNCRTCQECSQILTISELKLSRQTGEPPIHAKCAARLKFRTPKATLAIEQSDLDLLNMARLIWQPDVYDCQTETNKQLALNSNLRQWEKMNIEQKRDHVIMIEALFGQVYLLMKKESPEIRAAALEADRERITGAREKAESSTIKVRQAEKAQKLETKKKLSTQDKFLNAMLASGVDEETAKKIWISQGKDWTK